ncbi:CGNR zinc finger domain-containing protein [Kutzneria sp. NPDC052558]
MKLCRNESCPAVFHDTSRNGSRIWHDVSTCGNAANVRAHRARNRTFG